METGGNRLGGIHRLGEGIESLRLLSGPLLLYQDAEQGAGKACLPATEQRSETASRRLNRRFSEQSR